MGFRTGAYATVFEVKPVSDTVTDLRISISRKDNRTGEFVRDFAGYVRCLGTANAAKAARLHEKDRIKLGDVDVSNTYDKEKRVTYTNCKIWSFEVASSTQDGSSAQNSSVQYKNVDSGELDDSGSEDGSLPF